MVTEEHTLTVANSGAIEEEAIMVEAGVFDLPQGFDGPVTPLPGSVPKQPIPVRPDEPETQDISSERRWVQTNKAEDFPPFLLAEVKRMRPAHMCGGNRSEMERALGQHKRLNGYISKALQSDYDGTLDTKGIDGLRQKLEHGIDQLEHMLHGLDEMKKQRKRMRRKGEDEGDDGITKEAGVAPVRYFATAFQRAIAGAIINGKVSGGRDLDELYAKAKAKYALDDREELAIFQILADMGYPTFRDRLRIGEENQDPREGLGEWQKQYYG